MKREDAVKLLINFQELLDEHSSTYSNSYHFEDGGFSLNGYEKMRNESKDLFKVYAKVEKVLVAINDELDPFVCRQAIGMEDLDLVKIDGLRKSIDNLNLLIGRLEAGGWRLEAGGWRLEAGGC